MAFDENVPLAANQITADLIAMNANWEFLISGDGTAGRVFRSSVILIEDATTADEIKCTMISEWNGDAISAQDDIAEGETKSNFYYITAPQLKVEAAGLSGNVVGVLSATVYYNDCGTSLTVLGQVNVNDILLTYYDSDNAAAAVDLATLVDTATGAISVHVTYLTDA